ncbi:hypothetical protein [Kitasatospora sp. NPDC001175]|uniref:hypothetical protein n=1 Tax=Kitasatospora sp. NPDC001175 TaxID=3157103 RepID=UPI003D085C2F
MIVAAYVLAGELACSGGDHRAAFTRYERLLRDYARGCQKGGERTGRFLAPGAAGLRIRNGLLNRKFLLGLMLKAGRQVSTVALSD